MKENNISDKVNKSATEKKVFKAAVIDVDNLVDAQSRDIGDHKMTESKSDRSGNRVGRFFKRIWKHNIAQEYYRQKEISKVRSKILEDGNLYADSDVDTEGTSATNKTHHKIAMDSIIERFINDYSDEMLKDEEKQSKEKGSDRVNNQLKELVKEYASSGMSEDAFNEEKKRLISVFNPNYAKDQSLYADNLLDIAKEVRDSLIHNEKKEMLDFDLELTLGQARESLNTEAKKTTFDKILNKMGETRIGTTALNLGFGAVVAGAYSLTKFATLSLGKRSAKWLAFGAGLAAGGAIEGWKESVRINRDRAQHIRESAKGMKFTEDDMIRREEMEKNRYETVNASEIINNLELSIIRINNGEITDDSINFILKNLSDLEARIKIGDLKKIDLISYDNFATVEKDRMNMDLKRAELKVALRNNSEFVNSLQGESLDSYLNRLTSMQISDLTNKENGIDAKDRIFNKLKKKEVAKKVAQTIVIGAAFSVAFQEVSSLFTKEDGLIEGTVKNIRGAINNEDSGLSKDVTSLEALRRWFLNENPRIPTGISHESLIGDSHIHLPEGVEVVNNPDGTFNLVNGGSVVVENLRLGSDGLLDAESMKILAMQDINTSSSVIEEHTNIQSVKNSKDFVQEHIQGTHHVSRIHMDNDTYKFDKNELKLDWGGENNTGIDSNGNYVFNTSRMMPDGSYHNGISVDISESINKGVGKLLLSASVDTQQYVWEFDIDSNGNAIIPKDSIAWQHLFKVEDGHAVFTGKYAEVAEYVGTNSNGVENMRILATHIGTNTGEFVENEEIIKNVNHIKFDLPDSSDIEPPIPIPLSPRRPLEAGQYDKNKESRYKSVLKDKQENKNEVIKDVGSSDVKNQEFYSNREIAVFKEFEDFVRDNPDKPIPEDLEHRYFLAEQELKLNNSVVEASKKEQELFKEFEDFERDHPNELIPSDLEDRYRKAEEDLEKSIKARDQFLADSQNIEQYLKNRDIIDDQEFNEFVDTGKVSEERLNRISSKIVLNEPLGEREMAIFTNKTSEINRIIEKYNKTQ